MRQRHRLRVLGGVVLTALGVTLFSWQQLHSSSPPALVGLHIPNDATSGRVRRHPGQQVIRAAETNGATPSIEPALITGQVHDSRGDPVEGALVCVSCIDCNLSQRGAEPVCTRTDGVGGYEIQKPPQGRRHVSISAPGYRPRLAGLSKSEETDRDDKLEKGGAIVTGVVLDAAGGVVVGAEVRAIFDVASEGGPASVAQATESNTDGRFSLTTVQGPVRLIGDALGYAPADVVVQTSAQDVHLIVTPAGRICGTVVSQVSGEPVSNVRVQAVGDGMHQQFGTSGVDGTFTIDGLHPGRYGLHATGVGVAAHPKNAVMVHVLEEVSGVVLEVQSAVSVQAQVNGYDGTPCNRGIVFLIPERVGVGGQMYASIQAGKGRFEALLPGVYRVHVQCEGYEELEDVLSVGDRPLDVQWKLASGLALTILARDPQGNPVANAAVQLTSTNPTMQDKPYSGSTDADGQLILRGLPAGGYSVQADYLEPSLSIDLDAETAGAPLVLELAPVGSIELLVETSAGVPVYDVTVFGCPQGEPPQALARDLGEGRFFLGPVAVGPYQVFVDDGKNPVMPALSEDGSVPVVTSGQNIKLTVHLPVMQGVISGLVLDQGGAPLTNISVRATRTQGSHDGYFIVQQRRRNMNGAVHLTDAEGRFEITSLREDATFTVEASSLSDNLQTSREGVAAGSFVELQIPRLAALSGTITAKGEPVNGFVLTVYNRQNGQVLATKRVETESAWSLQEVPPGDVIIHAITLDQRAEATLQYTLQPGQSVQGLELDLVPSENAT